MEKTARKFFIMNLNAGHFSVKGGECVCGLYFS